MGISLGYFISSGSHRSKKTIRLVKCDGMFADVAINQDAPVRTLEALSL